MSKHIECDIKDISSKVLVCGDPARAVKIASNFQNSYLVADSREYWVCSGYFEGEFLTVCSTGIGGPSMAIAIEELIEYGAEIIIRLGSCGVFQENGKVGDIFVATGAIRHDGVSIKYLPLEIPCLPSIDLTNCLIQEAKRNKLNIQYGLGSCNDVYYKPFKTEKEIEKKKFYKKIGVLFGEMENSTLFSVGTFHGIDTASVLVSDSSVSTKKDINYQQKFVDGMESAIQLTLKVLATYKKSAVENKIME